LKKKFLVIGATGCAVMLWMLNTILGGILYATAAFLTKEGLEKLTRKKTDGT